MKLNSWLALGLLAISPSALALDQEFVVMGGFSTIVNAFQRIRLIFNDHEYEMLVTVFVIMGMLSALLFKAGKGGIEYLETGKAQMGLGWLVYALIGTMIYFGMVKSKGTIHIYDQTRNQYQAVGNVPNLLIGLAGVTNTIYQAFAQIADTNTASTIRFAGEGTAIKMLLGTLTRNGTQFNPYLTQNIKMLWNNCAPLAQARGFDPNVLKKGAQNLDVINALSPLRNQAAYTLWYSSSQPNGESVTCDQAYLSMRSAMGDPSAFNDRVTDVCGRNGYQITDASQVADCKNRMESGFQIIFGDSGMSLNTAMSNIVASQAIADALMESNPSMAASMLTNRAMINGGLVEATTAPDWRSTIMASAFAVILSVSPILMLLVFTPLMGKSLMLLAGLWIFITTWQITDLILLQATNDEILTALGDLKSMGLGIDAVQMGPTSAMKAMAVMASARDSAVNIAILVAGLFGVSAYGISSFGQKAFNRLDRATEDSADKALTLEGKGHLLGDMKQAAATEKVYAETGGSIDYMSGGMALSDTREVFSANQQISAMGGLGNSARLSGSVDAGRQVGNTMAYGDSPTGSYALAAQTAGVSTQSEIGESAGRQNSANSLGMSVQKQAELNSGVSNTTQTADNQSTMHIAGNNLQSLADQQRDLHSTERKQQLGSAQGIEHAAAATGNDVMTFAQQRTQTEAVNEYATGQGQLQAAGGTLSGLNSRTTSLASTESAERKAHADALHGAYGSNAGIETGLAATQTEQLTQDSYDMQEQRQNVGEIMNLTGKQEGDARMTLAQGRSAEQMGVLQGNNYDPRQMQDNTAYSTQKGASTIQGEKTAFEERNIQMPDYARRQAQIEMHRDLSGQAQFDQLSRSMSGDKAVADAQAGANQSLALTHDDAAKLQQAGVLTPDQAKAIPEDGVGEARLSTRIGEDGNIISSGSVGTGSNTSIDNGYKIEAGQVTGTTSSGQQVLQDHAYVEKLYDASNRLNAGSGARNLGLEAANSLSPMITQLRNESSTEYLNGGVALSKDGKGIIGGISKILGVDVSGGAGLSGEGSDITQYNRISGAFTNRVEAFERAATKEADVRGMTGDARTEFINQTVGIRSAQLYGDVLKAAQRSAEHTNGSILSDISNPDPNQPAQQPAPTASFSREGVSSPQEYLARNAKPGKSESVSAGSEPKPENQSANPLYPPTSTTHSESGVPQPVRRSGEDKRTPK